MRSPSRAGPVTPAPRKPSFWRLACHRAARGLLVCVLSALTACSARSHTALPATLTPGPTVRPTAPGPTPTPVPSPTATAGAATVVPAPTPIPGAPIYTYRVVNTYPHDPEAFTQGLVSEDGILYEGTGRYGFSSLREVDLQIGLVTRSVALSDDLFGEGIAIVGDRIVQLTWLSRRGFVYDRHTFELLDEFSYPTEGWGLAYDGEHLVMSDGTPTLHFLDPVTYEQVRSVEVRDGTARIGELNELEFVDGLLWANVWGTDFIVMIDPGTGQVAGWLSLIGLLDRAALDHSVDVLNGIAFDRDSGRLFVTGKFWPVLFEIEVVEVGGS